MPTRPCPCVGHAPVVSVERFEYAVVGWGTGEVWVRDGLLVHHELASGEPWHADDAPDQRRAKQPPDVAHAEPPVTSAGPRHGGASTPGVTVSANVQQDCVEFVPELCRRFGEHLRGREVTYGDIPIDLEWCTPLQLDIALALRELRFGEVVSYGELAERAGRPRAPRAAGSFCAQSPLQLVLPCHRVISASGIGGYGTSGVALKRRLLALEGVHL